MLFWMLACFQEKAQEIEFPTVLEPLEEIAAPLPDGDDYPEEIELRSEDGDEYASVHARISSSNIRRCMGSVTR